MKGTLWGVVFALLLCDVALLWFYGRKFREQQAVVNSLLPYAEQVNALTNNMLRNVSNVGASFSPNLMLTDTDGCGRTLESVIEGLGGHVLIARFSERHCSSCVSYSMDLIREVQKDTSWRIPIIYVADVSDWGVPPGFS